MIGSNSIIKNAKCPSWAMLCRTGATALAIWCVAPLQVAATPPQPPAAATERKDPGTAVLTENAADVCDRLAANPRLPGMPPIGVSLGRIDVPAATAACQSARDEAPSVPRFHYQLGRALLAGFRFGDARVSFEAAAKLGHAHAMLATNLADDATIAALVMSLGSEASAAARPEPGWDCSVKSAPSANPASQSIDVKWGNE